MAKKVTTYSAMVGTNADLFPLILKMYLPGGRVADPTYGKGVFWKQVDLAPYELLATDLATDGIDLRSLPYDGQSLDGIVLDPPYMPTEFTGVPEFSEAYGIKRSFGKAKWDKAVLDLYEDGMVEAARVLKPTGILIVKCQDMVCANRQVLVHCDLIEYGRKLDLECEDIFVLVQHNKRGHPRQRLHALKNHSYFLVFRRAGKRWTGPHIGSSSDPSDINPQGQKGDPSYEPQEGPARVR
jgi:hypothetical protein